MTTCAVSCCDRPRQVGPHCKAHDDRLRRTGRLTDKHGSLALRLRVPSASPEERFWRRVNRTASPNGCWLWTAGKNTHGYGRYSIGPKTFFAHRLAYGYLKGHIPEGLVLDHLCRNPSCVNPEHLEPVTNRVNVHRGVGPVSRTHCPQGHPYDTANTIWQTERRNGRRYTSRRCRTCYNTIKRKRYQTLKASEV